MELPHRLIALRGVATAAGQRHSKGPRSMIINVLEDNFFEGVNPGWTSRVSPFSEASTQENSFLPGNI
jgi:hypothetical protein